VIVRVWVGTSVFIRRPVPASEMLANDLDPTRGLCFQASDLAFLVGDTGLEPVTSSVSAAAFANRRAVSSYVVSLGDPVFHAADLAGLPSHGGRL
jgi:hypothetical protein